MATSFQSDGLTVCVSGRRDLAEKTPSVEPTQRGRFPSGGEHTRLSAARCVGRDYPLVRDRVSPGKQACKSLRMAWIICHMFHHIRILMDPNRTIFVNVYFCTPSAFWTSYNLCTGNKGDFSDLLAAVSTPYNDRVCHRFTPLQNFGKSLFLIVANLRCASSGKLYLASAVVKLSCPSNLIELSGTR